MFKRRFDRFWLGLKIDGLEMLILKGWELVDIWGLESVWVSEANYFRILEDFEGVMEGLEDELEIDD